MHRIKVKFRKAPHPTLDPCPCCGGEAAWALRNWDNKLSTFTGLQVYCTQAGCGMQTPILYRRHTVRDIITTALECQLADLWNRRNESDS